MSSHDSGPPSGLTFLGVFRVPDPQAPCPNMGAENRNFLKLLKTMIVGALWFRLGLLSIRILCVLKSNKMKILILDFFLKIFYFKFRKKNVFFLN